MLPSVLCPLRCSPRVNGSSGKVLLGLIREPIVAPLGEYRGAGVAWCSASPAASFACPHVPAPVPVCFIQATFLMCRLLGVVCPQLVWCRNIWAASVPASAAEPGWAGGTAWTGTCGMCRASRAKGQPRCSACGQQRAASLQINETLDCQLGSARLEMTSASGSRARRQEDGAIAADNNKTPLLTLTEDEKCFVRSHLFTLHVHTAHCLV